MLGGDPDVVEAGRTVLMGAGYTVAMATDMKDAVALWNHFEPDLLFIDVMGRTLPDGVGMAEAVYEAGMRVPILIMATADRRVEFFTYDADGTVAPTPDFLGRPMEPAALVRNVGHALARAEGTREA